VLIVANVGLVTSGDDTVTETITRYAAYLRFSSTHQIGNTSIAVQARTIQDYVARKSADDNPAIIVETYIDAAQSGKTLKRTEFDRLQRDAEKHKFDALIVYDWSRLSRDVIDAKTVKRRLRHDLKIEVFSVLELGESDNPDNKFIETIFEANYQRESDKHGSRVRNAHYQLFLDGWYRGRRAFGYNIKPVVTDVKPNGEEVTHNTLEPHPTEADAVRMIFDFYATGKWSFIDLVELLTKQGFKSVNGRLMSVDNLKVMLSNDLYLGFTTYQKTEYDSKKRRTYDAEIKRQRARHEPLVTQELFDKVQEMRKYRQKLKRKPGIIPAAYLLGGLVWCDHCYEQAVHGRLEGADGAFGKCRSQTIVGYDKGSYPRIKCYTCISHTRGCHECKHRKGVCAVVDAQIVSLLSSLTVPGDWRRRLVEQIAIEIGDERREERIATLREEIKRWNNVYATGQTHNG
jgi:site-specific DNA recombinase